MWIWIFLLVIISIYNTVYSFLPDPLRRNWWVKAAGIVAACVILFYGIFQIIVTYKNSSSAYVSANGEIIRSRNFRWKIIKTIDSDSGFPIYIIESRYGDASAVKIKPDRPIGTEVYNAMDGVAIKFFCKSDRVPNFKIIIGP
jgi:hypothetical protein